ncbi:helix-turn-helix domain-containing protein [Embleya sp. NPDC055664]
MELRRIRLAADLTLESVAARLGWSHTKVSRLETGQGRVSQTDVDALARLYATGDDMHQALVTLARESRAKGWWHDHASAVPKWFNFYIGLEAAAEDLRNYEAEFVPGLLQTEDYIRALYRAVRPRPEDEVDRLIRVRLERQRILVRDDPPTLWAVINEAVIRRAMGDPHVMRDQLTHLVEMSELPHITLQVLSFAAGGHAGMDGAFMMLGFEGDDSGVVYRESITDAAYVEDPDGVALYTAAFDQMRDRALDPAASRDMMTAAATEFR